MHYWLALIVGIASFCATLTAAAESPVRFEKDVLPILTQRCGSCHGRNEPEAGLSFGDLAAATKELESGTRAIVPSKPEESELLRRVTSSDPGERMPSKGPPLPQDQIDKLRQWIAEGAQWPEHWAYRQLVRPSVGRPFRADLDGPEGPSYRNAIDAFILQTLFEKQLTPSPQADKRTLLRRVSFDLVGLPPTPDDIDAFLVNQAPDAYERVVDRLLASPRHGERWARHWMDVVHYAETHGHDQDRPRENAWPYRDYLIRTFNADVPYGRFIEQQIAGDVLWPEDTSAIVATGFLATGPWDESSLRDIREDSIDREIGRYLDRDDIVSTVVNTFLSTTVQCARCHDHKFDPISQVEYYGLQAVFAATDKANRAYDTDPAVAAKRRELIAARSKLREQKEQLDAALLSAEVASEVAQWEKTVTAAASLWQVLTPIEVKSSEGSTLTVQSDGSVLSGGTKPPKDTYTLVYTIGLAASGGAENQASGGREPPDGAGTNLGPAGNQGADAPRSPMITGLRLEVLTDSSLPKQGPGRQDNGNQHLNELVVKFAPKDKPDGATSIKLTNPRADFNQQGWSIEMALDGNEATAWGIFPEVGKPHVAIFELAEPIPIAGEATLTVELKQLHGGGHLIGRPRISVTSADKPIPIDAPSLPAEVASILATPSDQRTDRQRADLAAFVLNLKYDRLLAALPPRQFVYAGTSDFQPDGSFKPADKPRAVHVLKRGDIHQPGDAAVPSGLSIMPKDGGALSIADASHEGQRRAALAKWIASPESGLTWRSIANRLWHYHFGRGIVDTPNDFGRMGSFPSHPELLDWLAAELRDHGGELKRLHRQMVTSATYRQASGGRTKASGGREPPDRVQGSGFRVQPTGNKGQQSDAANLQSAIRNPQAIDADNRLLWRMNRARLDAESIHDAVAAISGTLDLKMGGPSVRQFIQTPGIHVTPNVDYQGFSVDDPANYRRSVYRFIFRTLPDPFMESLDCADSSQLTPVRSASVTALQALAMLNDKFIVRQSEHLAERLVRDAATDVREQVRLLFRLVLSREPTDAERDAVAAYAGKHGLANACRVLLNSNEFMFVD
ncbi:MAG TPA: PSD1 and planctomycete cytochrome C domain-containing protein [Pirellulaceae bacterium]|nr:PSD1 and planctomycete cytochrome C domain-containing protein [Pirellulaceae bacterium]